ncbi:potassium channel subfamily [Apis cerana cerana]|uniref:Potassium channel subfamily n=1 Tax=Apis cerana cerana TaxID=94128 RepID=A0A2A3EGQ3_APICC|nr:potassium channel subfamily [Apis cerana cerana]
MSMYFFRLHNLRRQAEEVRKKRQKGKPSQSGQRGTNTDQSQPTAGSMHCCNKVHRGPSRLFERAPLQPSDSLDEIAFQIPSLEIVLSFSKL